MLNWLRNILDSQQSGSSVSLGAQEPDHLAPSICTPADPVGSWVCFGNAPSILMPLRDAERYSKRATHGENLYQCVRKEGSLVVVRNNIGQEYPVYPGKVIWVPVPQFNLDDYVHTKIGTPRIGWISHRQWHFKFHRLYYMIDIVGSNGQRKLHTRRYWGSELVLSGPSDSTFTE